MNIIEAFDSKKSTYDSFSQSLEKLLTTLISNAEVSVHTLDARVKERHSLEMKINRKEKYTCIEDITDIVGIRVITYYSDDVDKIAEVIENEFLVDVENSIDKRTSMEPDRFGYLSLHYIISFNDIRCDLGEYKKFKSMKAEIQIRSILQHAWAEIEHDIGYKSNIGLPSNIKRRFSRLAGLLEIADSEFVQIKDSIDRYKAEVGRELDSGHGDVELDALSIIEYINKSTSLDVFIRELITKEGISVSKSSGKAGLPSILQALEYLNIKTTKELDEKIKLFKSKLHKRLVYSMKEDRRISNDILDRQYVIGYLCQVMVAASYDNELERLYAKIALPHLNELEISNYFGEIRKTL